DRKKRGREKRTQLVTHVPHPPGQVLSRGDGVAGAAVANLEDPHLPGGSTMDASIQYQTQIVGARPAITAYFDELDLAATVDRIVPWEGEIPLGTLVEVLITNRLLRPKALFRIGEWAEAAAVTDYYDLTAAQLNDDRLGRALERLPRHAETIQAALTLKAIEQFRLDVHQIHYDISNVELYGAYEDFQRAEGQETTVPVPAYGRTKSGRNNLHHIQFG